jgi:hypothetical protein
VDVLVVMGMPSTFGRLAFALREPFLSFHWSCFLPGSFSGAPESTPARGGPTRGRWAQIPQIQARFGRMRASGVGAPLAATTVRSSENRSRSATER